MEITWTKRVQMMVTNYVQRHTRRLATAEYDLYKILDEAYMCGRKDAEIAGKYAFTDEQAEDVEEAEEVEEVEDPQPEYKTSSASINVQVKGDNS